MTEFTQPTDRRRRRRNYPLPQQGMRAKDPFSRLSKNDLRHARSNGILLNPGRGLYIPQRGNREPEIVGLLQALAAGGNCTVSHETAAAMHGLPGKLLQAPFHVGQFPLRLSFDCQAAVVANAESLSVRWTRRARPLRSTIGRTPAGRTRMP